EGEEGHDRGGQVDDRLERVGEETDGPGEQVGAALERDGRDRGGDGDEREAPQTGPHPPSGEPRAGRGRPGAGSRRVPTTNPAPPGGGGGRGRTAGSGPEGRALPPPPEKPTLAVARLRAGAGEHPPLRPGDLVARGIGHRDRSGFGRRRGGGRFAAGRRGV